MDHRVDHQRSSPGPRCLIPWIPGDHRLHHRWASLATPRDIACITDGRPFQGGPSFLPRAMGVPSRTTVHPLNGLVQRAQAPSGRPSKREPPRTPRRSGVELLARGPRTSAPFPWRAWRPGGLSSPLGADRAPYVTIAASPSARSSRPRGPWTPGILASSRRRSPGTSRRRGRARWPRC